MSRVQVSMLILTAKVTDIASKVAQRDDHDQEYARIVFPFSQVYQIDGGRVVLSVQLSEHVTIDQDRLNQSGIDTLRSLSLDQTFVFSIVILCETENLLAFRYICSHKQYIYIYIYIDLYIEKYFMNIYRVIKSLKFCVQ